MFKGFFNRMYNGNPNRPDINPEDMPKNRFELFFTTLGLRFGDLVKLNLLFVLSLLPLIIWTVLSIGAIIVNFNTQSTTDAGALAATDQAYANSFGVIMFYLLGLLVALPLAGPPLAGLSYITRNYARDEHVWLWSDFKEQMKKNWKQSMATMFLFALVLYLFVVTLQIYGALQADKPTVVFLGFINLYVSTAMNGTLMGIMQTILILFVGIFFLSYIYVFPMLVTYKLKLGQILRNSLMLSIGRLPFTVLFGVMSLFPVVLGVILLVLTASYYVILVLVLYYLLLGFSLTAFILNSYTNATFDRLMKVEEETPEDNADEK
jgi:uncharacterized membrane protein YesL